MEILMPILAGSLIAAGLYLLMRRNVLAIFVGLVILSHGVNLVIFTAGGISRGEPPIAGTEWDAPPADPLAQALVLTAIVIGLGVQAFLLTLVYRLVSTVGSSDLEAMRETDTSDTVEGSHAALSRESP